MKGNVIVAIDRLGAIRAQIATLREQEKDAEQLVRVELEKQAARDPNAPHVDGELFRATLVVQFRDSLIADKVRELLHPNTLRACTRTTEVRMIKLTARSTEKLAIPQSQ